MKDSVFFGKIEIVCHKLEIYNFDGKSTTARCSCGRWAMHEENTISRKEIKKHFKKHLSNKI